MVSRAVRACVWVVYVYMAFVVPAAASAQSAVGQGPLTGSLPDVEPTAGVLTLGRVKLAPGLSVREIGWDSNVFNEADELNPKEDYVAAILPDVSIYSRLRFVRISAYAGSDLTYYRTHESERSVGHAVRGRADVLLSRVRPFFGVGQTETRTRPNGEIDVRADRKDEEVSGGLAFDLSSQSLVYASGSRSSAAYENAIEDGVDLGRTLSREAFSYQAGLKTDLTPFVSMQLFAGFNEDRFEAEPIRDSQSWSGTATFRIDPAAVVTGAVTVGYRDASYADPRLKPFRGLVGTAAIVYPFLEVGRLSLALSRGVEYSFDTAEGYYLEQAVNIAYTHRLFGAVDAQVRGGRAWFEYDALLDEPAHTDTYQVVAGSIGYNLRNRTRIALNLERERRSSPSILLRNYERRRAYLSWVFAF